MGTGILSVALSLDGDETISRTLLVTAAPMWVTLAVLVSMRAGRDHVRFLADQQSSRAGAVTGVGIERGLPGDGSLELTADVAAGESEMTVVSDSSSWTRLLDGTSRDCFSRKARVGNPVDARVPAARVAYARWRATVEIRTPAFLRSARPRTCCGLANRAPRACSATC